MATPRTWKIRDQLPDGSFGPERSVTLEQYREEVAAKSRRAIEIFQRNAAAARAAIAGAAR